MVTVYYTWIPDNLAPGMEGRWLETLPPDKRDAIRRLRFDKGRAASLLGLQLLKHAMQEFGYADFQLSSVCFPRAGKPCCSLPVDFNISHSKAMVVCALSTDSKIGVDTEILRAIRIESFQRFLSARERDWVGEDRQRFFELWTQKEAVVKGHGEGGIANLRRVSIHQGKGTIDSRVWILQALNIHPDYVTHVAIEGDYPCPLLEAQYVVVKD